MKKATVWLLALALLLSLAAAAEETEGTETLRAGLEAAGYYVQQGTFRELDTVKEASAGRLLSCFGNNAGSAYLVFNMPAAPDQETSKGNEERGWPDEQAAAYDDPAVENMPANPYFAPGGWEYKLRQDEAIILITSLPPRCKYYSFINYIMFTQQKPDKDYTREKGFFSVGNEEIGLYHPIFGSIGDSVNFLNIRTRDGENFASRAVMVISSNQTVTADVLPVLEKAGYPQSKVNLMTIPAGTYRMGLEKGCDTFSFLGRISQAEDPEAYRTYLDTIGENSVLLRITPREEIAPAPYENNTVIARGTGVHEAAGLENAAEKLDRIRTAILSKYAGEYDYEELSCSIAVPEGQTAYFTDTNAQGDNRDAMYLMTPDFTLNSDEDFIMVYGLNHTATGKAMYSNAVLYARPMLNGVCSVYDSLFAGSAAEFLGEDSDEDLFYVYRLAREKTDDYTAEIPYSTGNARGKYYGVDNGNPLIMAFRAYMDTTGVGASYYEVVYDRVIIFHKK